MNITGRAVAVGTIGLGSSEDIARGSRGWNSMVQENLDTIHENGFEVVQSHYLQSVAGNALVLTAILEFGPKENK